MCVIVRNKTNINTSIQYININPNPNNDHWTAGQGGPEAC